MRACVTTYAAVCGRMRTYAGASGIIHIYTPRLIGMRACVTHAIHLLTHAIHLLTHAIHLLTHRSNVSALHFLHPSASVSIRQHPSASVSLEREREREIHSSESSLQVPLRRGAPALVRFPCVSSCQLGTEAASIRQHTSAYVSIRQCTSAYVRVPCVSFCHGA
jgi:hypothetical protein